MPTLREALTKTAADEAQKAVTVVEKEKATSADAAKAADLGADYAENLKGIKAHGGYVADYDAKVVYTVDEADTVKGYSQKPLGSVDDLIPESPPTPESPAIPTVGADGTNAVVITADHPAVPV